ncbi:MAG: hypothetical protein ACYCW6_15020 [Candidatus Xenobia bacterium]
MSTAAGHPTHGLLIATSLLIPQEACSAFGWYDQFEDGQEGFMNLVKLADDRYAIQWDDGEHSFVSRREVIQMPDGTIHVKHYGGKATFVFNKDGAYLDEFYGEPTDAKS